MHSHPNMLIVAWRRIFNVRGLESREMRTREFIFIDTNLALNYG